MAAVLARARFLLSRTMLNPSLPLRSISSSPFLSQEPQLQESPAASPLPPNPSIGSPFYNENWRHQTPSPGAAVAQSIVPLGIGALSSVRMMAFSQTLDAASLMNVFADWMASQRWSDLKQLFEFWIRSLDATGKLIKPDVNIYNHYLRANLMMGASPGELLDLVVQMQDYQITPNTASYNLVLKAMHQTRESEAAEKTIDRIVFVHRLFGVVLLLVDWMYWHQ
ncbi:HAD domain-containing protein [Dioscorea alata]|uniref:HAD domain-containing protein n=1 Tax=Dioscorea alata TaxID=55571 RepID=A0ACB7TWF1_DIOAL|nr:HAD domain-containing protein [Dioscorea alata]